MDQSAQKLLHEDLLLLQHVFYDNGLDQHALLEAVGQHSNKNVRNNDTNRELRALDTLTVALATGNPGKVFAATRRENTIFFASNDVKGSREDISYAKKLTSMISYPLGEALPVYSLIFQRCWNNINMRVQKLKESLDGFPLDVAFRTGIVAKDFITEIPGVESSNFYKSLYKSPNLDVDKTRKPLSARHCFNLLFNLIKKQVQQFKIGKGVAEEDTLHQLEILANDSMLIYRSKFMARITASLSRNVSLSAKIAQLQRRILKVRQYYHGVQDLALYYGNNQKVRLSAEWIPTEVLCPSIPDKVGNDLLQVMQVNHANDVQCTTDELREFLGDDLGKRQEIWGKERVEKVPKVHAEVRIICHFWSQPGNTGDILIGCSKRSCLCCTLWMNLCNKRKSIAWMTSGTHGKAYSLWGLPYVQVNSESGQSDISINTINQALIADILSRLKTHFSMIRSMGIKRARPRSVSDEYCSNDEGGVNLLVANDQVSQAIERRTDLMKQ